MAWEIKDEHFDLAESAHRVIFVNRGIVDRHGNPLEHHLTILLGVESCPHCGRIQEKEAVDIAAVKKRVHEALAAHEAKMLEYPRRHNVRVLKAAK